MTTVAWPTAPGFEPQRMTWGIRAAQSRWTAFYTGQFQSLLHAGPRLVVQLTLPPCRASAAGAREAFLSALHARGDWVRLPHFARRVPLGNVGPRTGPTVRDNAAAGASSVTLTGLTTARNLLANGSFEIDSNSDGLANGWSVAVGGAGDAGRVHAITQQNTNGTVHGTYSQHVQITAAGNSQDSVLASGQIPVATRTTYTFACSCYPNVGGKVYLLVRESDGGLGTLADHAAPAFFAQFVTGRHSITFTTDPACAYVQVMVRGITAPGEYFRADAAQLELGATATDFAGYPNLAAGDVFSVGDQLIQCAYPGAAANDAGVVAVPTVLPLRKALTATTPAVFDQPTGLFQLVGSEFGADYRAPLVQGGVDLQFIEVFA